MGMEVEAYGGNQCGVESALIPWSFLCHAQKRALNWLPVTIKVKNEIKILF